MNKHYIYGWVHDGIPFYIGQGTKEFDRVEKYRRAYGKHYSKKTIPTFAQSKANKLLIEGTPHTVQILFDDLTKEEADTLERKLIRDYGRRCDKTGILCNITEGGDYSPHSDPNVYKKWLEARRAKTKEIMADPEQYKKYHDALVDSIGNKIEFNGIVYRSMIDLAKHLNIGISCLRHRLKNNIPLDLELVEKKKEFEFNGIVFKNRKELCEHLGITVSTYKYRINHNIPLDNKIHEGKGVYVRV